MKVYVTEALRSLAKRHRIFTADPGDMWPLGGSVYVGNDATVEPYAHILSGTVIPKAIGAFSYAHSLLDNHLSIGRYTSISWRMTIMGSAHPAHWASSHPFSHGPWPLHGIRAYLLDTNTGPIAVHAFDQGPQEIVIGNDVWIGAEVMIKRGVTIGDGAVIAARSIITKDVPPYAIVGGSPARLIRYRFDEALIEDLQASQWWRYGPDVLQQLDVRDPVGFPDRLREAEARGDIRPMTLDPLTATAIIEASVIGRPVGGAPTAP
ncbi:CatB-related O-acetyltransferase [Caulobacter sp. ErkDOM-YI]|uniref:CatB-related O-acetyltransferase n=1 Tax=unclassified Caulobacter TaxID=2648921 RepID=UPI003AF85DF1